MNYISAVGRKYIINESTIKIPATEYLQVTEIQPRLEFGHPKFKQKRIDLQFKDIVKNVENVFEFKYVKGDSTRDLKERKRIFYDLMRLYYFLEPDKKGYFLICGIQEDFKLSFEKLDLTPKYVTPTSAIGIPAIKSTSYYSTWFSFDEAAPTKTIDLNNIDPQYKEVYDAFMNEFKDPYKDKTGNKLVKPAEIITNLIFLSQESTAIDIPQTFKIGIWQVIV